MNTVIKNGLVLEHDEKSYSVEKKDIFIKDDLITAVGKRPIDFSEDKTIDAEGKFIIPGLINCHTHAYMTILRNYADDLPFDKWLFENIMPMEDKLIPEDAYWGSLLTYMEMIRSGTTCFLDMHMFKGQSVLAAGKIGIRGVISRGLVGDANNVGKCKRVEEAFDEMKEGINDLITFALAPHAIYTCDIEYLKYVKTLAKENNLRLHIHLSESRNEVENCQKQHNLTPVELLDSIGFFEVPTIAAHCVHLTENDMKILKEKNVSAVTNPISNMKLGNGFAPIEDLLDKDINVALGTDGASSNNALNLFREMSMLSLIHKGKKEDACVVSAFDSFKFATINGAKALGKEEIIGRIAPGMKADIVIINMDEPQLKPYYNLMSAMSYSMNGSEVESVMINGNLVMENKSFTAIDEQLVYENIKKIEERIKTNGK